jgi:hypothetical protein
MSVQSIENILVEKLNRIINHRNSTLVLGNFELGDIVCQIIAPFPEWQASLGGDARPELQIYNAMFHRLRRFMTKEDPQLTAKVFNYTRTKELATFAWDNLPPTSPGREVKSFWHNGYCYIIRRNLLARYRKEEGEMDILVSSKRTITYVSMAIRFALSILLAEKGGLILHAAGLVNAGKAFLFFGVSESGKSTIAQISQADAILSDEAVIICKKENKWLAYGTPFSGSLEYAGDNVTVDLAALIKLSKAKFHRLSRISHLRSVSELLKAVFILDDSPENKTKNLYNTLSVAEDVPVFDLEFLPESSVWPFVLKHFDNL